MKIGNINRVKFSTLSGGDVFIHDGDVYMKLDASYTEIEYNAVLLTDGELSSIFSDTFVVPLPNVSLCEVK